MVDGPKMDLTPKDATTKGRVAYTRDTIVPICLFRSVVKLCPEVGIYKMDGGVLGHLQTGEPLLWWEKEWRVGPCACVW